MPPDAHRHQGRSAGAALDAQEEMLNSQRYDASGATHYNYFRDYDPAIGRYVQSDPIGLRAGPNTYGYVGAKPLAFRDKFGLSEYRAPGWSPGWAPIPGFGDAIQQANANIAQRLSKLFNGIMNNDNANDDGSAQPKPDREQKPENCPAGTKPVDQDKRLDRKKIHDIKRGLGAGPRDWVGIDPEGNLWTNEGGSGQNNGPYTDYLP